MATFRGSGSVENGAAFPTEAELQAAVDAAEAAAGSSGGSATDSAAAQASAEAAQAAAETAQTSAEAASVDANAAEAAALAAQASAEAAETSSLTAQTAAELAQSGAEADLLLTNADVVSTNADVVSTSADVVLTNADVTYSAEWANKAEDLLVSAAAGGDTVDDYSALHWANKANADAVATAADLVATNQDTIDTAADLVATNQDTIDTAADLVATNQDTIDTAADLVLTNADVVSTNADAVLTAADVVTVEGIYDDFDDRYLGSKTSDPTLDNDGNALLTGALYFNSTSNQMKVYSGTVWIDQLSETDADLLYQPLDDELSDIALIAPTKGRIIAGNGTAWVELGVGTNNQVLTADSAETTGLKWAASAAGSMETFESAGITSATARTVYSYAHSLSGVPQIVQGYMECVGAEFGWAVGERMTLFYHTQYLNVERGVRVSADATNAYLHVAQDIKQPDRSTAGNIQNYTFANWKFVVTCIYWP